MTTQIADLQTHWPPIAPLFSFRTEEEYDAAVDRMNVLLDEIGTNEVHPLYSLLDTLGTIIHSYEAERLAIPNTTGSELVEFLMNEHGLSSSDLPEIGSASQVEEYLAGRIELSVSQIRAIANRFHVSKAAFM
jgi:HTH-type transcriptional regulator / antitoxin HigA